MTPPEKFLIPALAALLIVACNQAEEKPKGAAAGERTEEPEPETPKDAPKGPFGGFDFEQAKAAWQGSWVLDGEVAGKQVAWMIDGTELTQFDGAGESKLEFAVYSPCQVTYTNTDAGTTTYKNFVVVGDTLHTGLGSSGVVVADATIVCTGGKTYVLRAGTCEAWSEMFDDWKSKPAECTIEGEGAERKFIADGNTVPFISETALATTQLQRKVATKHPNFAAAKAVLTAPPEPAATP